jgi:DNA modification methylase
MNATISRETQCAGSLHRMVGRHSWACLILGDCLDALKDLQAVDAVITDLPYGVTEGEWDVRVNLAAWWEAIGRVCNGRVVTTCSQPYTTDVIASNREAFKYAMVWDKGCAANFGSAKKTPLRVHEDVLVFGGGTYNPQRRPGQKNHSRRPCEIIPKREHMTGIRKQLASDESGMKWPTSIIYAPKHTSRENLHPTQKPVELMRYLVETYTNPGETVCDPFAGSGTTGIACAHSRRNFIGIERDASHYATACARIAHELDGALL